MRLISSIFGFLTVLLVWSPSIFAANPVMIQGTSDWIPEFYLSARGLERERTWIGLLRGEYVSVAGSPIKAGGWVGQDALFNTTSADDDGHSDISLKILRFGVRGYLPESDIDYLLLLEAGDNIQTKMSEPVIPVEWSLTFNRFPGMRLRAGQFHYPGSEEGMKTAIAQHYAHFSNPVNMLLLERYFDGDGSDPRDANRMNGPTSGFTDIGVQLFDQIAFNGWENTYAIMIGQGNGPNRSDNNTAKDIYLYYALEEPYGGIGYSRQGWKWYTWYQHGERRVTTSGAGEYPRERYGLGMNYLKQRWRVEWEYVGAHGMIPAGSDGGAIPGAYNNTATAVASYNLLREGGGRGWYLDIGYLVTPDFTVSARTDKVVTFDSAGYQREQKGLTLGAEYQLNDQTKIMLNHEFRSARFPNLEDNDLRNIILSGMDDRLSLQVTMSWMW